GDLLATQGHRTRVRNLPACIPPRRGPRLHAVLAARSLQARNGSCRVKAVYSELHRSHDPQFFLVRGVVTRTTEQPERADRLLKGLKDGKHRLVEPVAFGQGPRARIHSPEYLSFLAEAWDDWTALGNAGPEMIGNVHPVRHSATYPTHIV